MVFICVDLIINNSSILPLVSTFLSWVNIFHHLAVIILSRNLLWCVIWLIDCCSLIAFAHSGANKRKDLTQVAVAVNVCPREINNWVCRVWHFRLTNFFMQIYFSLVFLLSIDFKCRLEELINCRVIWIAIHFWIQVPLGKRCAVG